ncbi:MAG TPA: hypothetical protein VNJ07_00290 [Chitinophagales bacterium]|nr:hypothetical protein [Chitinophagales bacterium]
MIQDDDFYFTPSWFQMAVCFGFYNNVIPSGLGRELEKETNREAVT